MLKLGNLYREGRGVEKDLVKAGRWSVKAANAGVRAACINVGLHYMMGWGTKKNLVKAFAYYTVAGEKYKMAKLQAFEIYKKLSENEKMEAEVYIMKLEKIFPVPKKK